VVVVLCLNRTATLRSGAHAQQQQQQQKRRVLFVCEQSTKVMASSHPRSLGLWKVWRERKSRMFFVTTPSCFDLVVVVLFSLVFWLSRLFFLRFEFLWCSIAARHEQKQKSNGVGGTCVVSAGCIENCLPPRINDFVQLDGQHAWSYCRIVGRNCRILVLLGSHPSKNRNEFFELN